MSALDVDNDALRLLFRIRDELQLAADNLNAIHQSASTLQQKSNRQVHSELKQVLETLQIPDKLSNVIMDERVDTTFQDAAQQVDIYMSLASDAQGQGIRCASETLILGGDLIRRVCSKTDVFFHGKLRALGKEVSSMSALQQSVFVKLEGLYSILNKYDNPKAGTFRREYLEVAQKSYQGAYRQAVEQFGLKKVIPLAPTPLIGEVRRTSTLSRLTQNFKTLFSGSMETQSQVNPRSPVSTGTIQIQESELVSRFTAVLQLLYDMIKRESVFARDFFKIRTEDLKDYLVNIFGPSAASFMRRIQEKIFLAANLVEVIQLYSKIDNLKADHDENQFLSSMLKSYSSYLSTRIEMLLLNQVQSLDAAMDRDTPQTSVSIVSRRFASLVINVVSSVESGMDSTGIKGLLNPVMQSMEKFQSHSAALLVNARSQSIYLINNYDFLMNFLESNLQNITPGQVFLSELVHEYDQKLNQTVNSFVLEELRPYFSLLFEHLTRHELGHTTDDPTTMELIVSDFNENITDRVKTINSSLLQDFSDHRTAVFVVNVIFSQLLTAYQQFLDFHDQLIGKDRLDDGSTIPIPMSISEVEQRLCRFHPTSREGRAEGRKVIG